MTPQDLRIGNYVRIKATGTIVQVRSISTRKIGFHYAADKTRMYYRNYSEIEPVRIYDVYGSLPYIKYLEWVDDAAFEGLYLYRGIALTDIHELQNVNRDLIGTEIEIEI